MEKKSGHAPVNGLQMYYEIHGDGEMPLVLIHGGGSTIQTTFGNILPLLAASHKVIAVELQAHGRTNDRDAPETFDQDAADVAGLLNYLKVEKANILGFSNGGSTILKIAINYPGLVNKIVLISAAYQRDGMIPGFFDGFPSVTLNDMPQPLKDGFLAVTPDEAKLENMFNKDKERMMAFTDFNENDVRSIKAPALVMAAQLDVVTPEHTIKISRLIANAQLVILPGFHGSLIGDVCTAKPGSRQVDVASILINEFLNE